MEVSPSLQSIGVYCTEFPEYTGTGLAEERGQGIGLYHEGRV